MSLLQQKKLQRQWPVAPSAGENWQAVATGANQELVIGNNKLTLKVFYVGASPEADWDGLWQLPYPRSFTYGNGSWFSETRRSDEISAENQTEIQLHENLCNSVREAYIWIKECFLLDAREITPGNITQSSYEYLILSFAKWILPRSLLAISI